MISIDERPPKVANRVIFGHRESDLIFWRAHQSALGTLMERTTRKVVIGSTEGPGCGQCPTRLCWK